MRGTSRRWLLWPFARSSTSWRLPERTGVRRSSITIEPPLNNGLSQALRLNSKCPAHTVLQEGAVARREHARILSGRHLNHSEGRARAEAVNAGRESFERRLVRDHR